MRTLSFSFFLLLLTAACQRNPQSAPTRELGAYRTKFPTKLTRHGPPPESWRKTAPLELPSNVDEVIYDSGSLKLRAWLSRIPTDGKEHPAVVFCHSGFWFDNADWAVIQPFLDAGFVVMAPRVRAENGNPGDFEYLFGEVTDIIAAGRYLAVRSGIDKSRLFVSGHGSGGDLAALAVMLDNPFAMAAPIGATLDLHGAVHSRANKYQQLVVFNAADPHEVVARSALYFTSGLRSPVHLFHGRGDEGEFVQREFVLLAQSFKHEASLTDVTGNYEESLHSAIPAIIDLFGNKLHRRPDGG